VLVYLKDGTMSAASDYWIADGRLHYTVNYVGESTVDIDQVDLQRTVDENAKRGVRFSLKPSPNSTASAHSNSDQRNGATPAAAPAPAPTPVAKPELETVSQPAD
jgi:hypothetical protein